MANHENFRDPSGAVFGWIAVVLFIGVPALPAILQWFKYFTG